VHAAREKFKQCSTQGTVRAGIKEGNTVIRKSFDDLKSRVSMKQEELKKDDKKVKILYWTSNFWLAEDSIRFCCK